MASKYELTIASGYVGNWTVSDAVRELFQNAIDQQTHDASNTMSFEYDGTDSLVISNKNSVLTANTLLLGSTTKSNDDNQIGQFGEGYKIATLVLLRFDKEITFYNYGAMEVWKPKMVKSRRYNGEKILTFFVDNKHIWDKVPDNNLTIVVNGITPDEYEGIKENNLRLQDEYNKLNTIYGDILLDECHAGKIFVSGLFVKRETDMAYGYDIKPSYLKLNRDRKMVESFDIQWTTSRMILNSKNKDVITKAVDFADSKYINSVSDGIPTEASSKAYNDFKSEYGGNAVPVYYQSQADDIVSKYDGAKPVIVSESRRALIVAAPSYHINAKPIVHITPRERLDRWFAKWSKCLPPKAIKSFNDMMEQIENEGNGDVF